MAERAWPVRLTRRARKDLADIFDYVAAENRVAAEDLVGRLLDRGRVLAPFPQIGTQRADIGRDVRSLIEDRYVIVYRIGRSEVQIVRIVHGARAIGRHMLRET